ncbi:MAG: hypothetical protein ACRYFX_27105 [Janthinobacterium lividum]
MTSELHEAIEQLYRVFAKYPADPNMDGSPMYHDLSQWNQALLAKPLHKLSIEEDLLGYYFKAMITWGGVADFKHFLPRIFELLTTLPTGIDENVALGKLTYGKYETWPASEQAAIHQFLLAFWQMLLSEASDWIDTFSADYFPAIANVYPDFNQLLQLWTAAENQEAAQRLAWFVCRHTKQLLKKRVFPRATKSELLGRLFLEWLHTPAAVAKLKRAVPDESAPYLNFELDPIIKELE